MALTNPPAAPDAPPATPSRADEATFDARADNAWTWLFTPFWTFVSAFRTWYAGTAVPELEALQADVTAKQVAATAAVGAAKWISGAEYALGECAWSPINGQSYRRIVAGAGATDPSADAVNWAQISISPVDTLLTNPTITNYTEPVYAPAAGAAFVVDLANGSNQVFTTNANCTITLPAPVAGKSYTIDIKFGGAHTVTWVGGGTLCWPNATAPTVTSVNGKRDSFAFSSKDAVNTHGSIIALNYAA